MKVLYLLFFNLLVLGCFLKPERINTPDCEFNYWYLDTYCFPDFSFCLDSCKIVTSNICREIGEDKDKLVYRTQNIYPIDGNASSQVVLKQLFELFFLLEGYKNCNKPPIKSDEILYKYFFSSDSIISESRIEASYFESSLQNEVDIIINIKGNSDFDLRKLNFISFNHLNSDNVNEIVFRSEDKYQNECRIELIVKDDSNSLEKDFFFIRYTMLHYFKTIIDKN